ncbi:MAG TPA: redoxin domain-containing protein [Blastocatellia bacterium]|nr:redoxin domain-containing protein [Blastocatellia bacterium]
MFVRYGLVILQILFILSHCLLSAEFRGVSAQESVRLFDLTGRQVEPLRETDARAVVFIFTRTDCPISNRYAPEVRRLHEKFAAKRVAFWLVYVDPDETAATIRAHLKEYDYHSGVLRDPQHALVKLTGASVTPEAAVFVPGGQMAYRGRIDNRYVALNKKRPAPTTRDLEQVLEAILAGKPITKKTTPAVGCFISDLR